MLGCPRAMSLYGWNIELIKCDLKGGDIIQTYQWYREFFLKRISLNWKGIEKKSRRNEREKVADWLEATKYNKRTVELTYLVRVVWNFHLSGFVCSSFCGNSTDLYMYICQ